MTAKPHALELWPRRLRARWAAALCAAVVLATLALALVGAWTCIRAGRERLSDGLTRRSRHALPAAQRLPVSKMPGPPRNWEPPDFRLTNADASVMQGMDDRFHERWSDIAGNHYSTAFVRRFSYAASGSGAPLVRIRVEPVADTLRGRLEARRLKPNFASQIKLQGVFEDRRSYEAIGYAGRWRLPGRGTNYTDDDYRNYPEPSEVEAYLLFDFFVTDANGNAARDFALDSSLHVLWNASRQRQPGRLSDLVPAVVDASNPDVYSRPKPDASVEYMWAERSHMRYRYDDQVITLPEGDYTAEIVLTEESLHANGADGGWWATVYRCPVAFTIRRPSPTAKAAPGDPTDSSGDS